MTPEGRVKAIVTRALRDLPETYRFMPVQNGMGAPALDYYGCHRGWFFAVETKVEGKNLTPRQEATKAAIEAAGGIVFVVRNKHDVEVMIAKLALLPSR